MTTLIIPQPLVAELLPMGECIDVMERALASLARGEAILPLRTMMWTPDRSGLIAMMPSHVTDPQALGLKVISVMAANHGTDRDSHQGAVLLFDARTGSLLAIIDATAITAIRTAAVSGLATRLLAREDAGDLAILGSGTQASTHLAAMRAVRRLRRVRVCGVSPERARAFARHHSESLGITVEAVGSARDAVEGADLICTATSSVEPVVKGAWIAPGAHINAVGACFPACRELDTEAVVRSRFYCDRRESVGSEAGDFLIPRREGAIGSDHIVGEIGEVAIGRAPGRSRPDEITLFKSLGIAVEDVAAAEHIHRRARAVGKGFLVDLGGRRMTYD